MSGENILVAIEIIIGLLFLATLVGILARRMRFPYTVGLVIMGLALGFFNITDIDISPELILGLFVPPLIFEAASQIRGQDLRRDLPQILAFAIPGVVLTMVLVGGVVAWGTGFELPVALVFGALVAATDPVAVVALFRTLGVPKRLQVLLEGESLFNDGTAIVIFNIVVMVVIEGAFNPIEGLTEFLRVAGGGLIVGLIMGGVISFMISRINEHLIETTLTSILAWGSYITAENLHVSGVLAVVAAGLVIGNIGPRGMSPTTRIVVSNFWEFAAFLANSLVFLLIGAQIELGALLAQWQPIFWAILAVLVARAVSVYGFSWLGRDFPYRWNHILYWGGLRGAISLGLALALPQNFGPTRETIQLMAFGVVLFTLLVQGISMGPLVKRLRLIERSETQLEYERRHARAVIARSAYRRINEMHTQGLISVHSWEILAPLLEKHTDALAEAVVDILHSDPSVEVAELDNAWREGLRAQRSVLNNLLTDGVISEQTYSELLEDIDAALIDRETSWAEIILSRLGDRPPVTKLIAAVLQPQDVENVVSSLTVSGVPVTRLPSTGGFLRKRNVTLLIGLMDGQEEDVLDVIKANCKQRVEYISTPFEDSQFPIPATIPIQIGGATIFAFKVERYEEI